MKYWDANCTILQEKYPGLLEQIAKDPGPYPVRIETSQPGEPTLLVKGRYAHSPRDPVREGRRLAETLSEHNPAVILGFGLGYAVEAAAEKTPARPIIIAEAHPGLLKPALETRDLRGLFSKHRLIFVLGGAGDGITGALQVWEKITQEKASAPSLIRNRSLITLDEAWYAQVERHIKVWTFKDDVNTATLKRFGPRWVRNIARNLTALRDLPGLQGLSGALDFSMPVLLTAAGPSLDEVLPFLPEMRRRCIIVAVDTSLRMLARAGVEPDFTVVADPQYWNTRHIIPTRSCLIAESGVYPSVLRGPFARSLLCSSQFPLGQFIEDRLGAKGRLGAGGSVATTAWDFARLLGPSRIWIAGLDLAYPALKTHGKGALFEDRALAETTRFNPLESWSVRALREAGPFWGPSGAGGKVLTDQRLSLYGAWFENRLQRVPKIPNIRLSGAGLAIAGLPVGSADELLALPACREEADQCLQNSFARIDADFWDSARTAQREADYDEAVRDLRSGLSQLQAWADEAGRIPDSLYNQDRIVKKLEALDQRIQESPVKAVAGFLTPPIRTLEADLENEDKPFIRHLKLSKKIYRSLSDAAGYILSVLPKY
ncbi:MAG: DUF115 domain-containing protein [Spirochaetaceae bacterium]|jgi:hypothetical protein|nr:DUF115 domain-containing protein [Spirochaetaceae bacterium]